MVVQTELAKWAEVGARIQTARIESGVSAAACAKHAGIDEADVEAIERGERAVSATELASLAESLSMRMEWFFRDAPQSVISRRQGRSTSGTVSEIDWLSERLAREIEFVQRIGNLKLADSPRIPFSESNDAMEGAANRTRKLLGYDGFEPAQRLSAQTVRLGLLTFSLPLDDRLTDGASIMLARGGLAVVNGSHPAGRRRLTLAHEIGHYVFADEYSVDAADSSRASREARIDRFARALLLPVSALRREWGGSDMRTDAVRIASEYRVDMSTLARRLIETNLADEGEAAFVRKTRTQRSDIESLGLVVAEELRPPELPSAYTEAVLDLVRREQISRARCVELLLETVGEDELPEPQPRPAEAIWSVVS